MTAGAAPTPGKIGATPARVALALVIGSLGGAAAQAAELPLAWMIGAMLATTLAAALGLPIAMWLGLRSVMVAVLGVMLGSAFSPEILDRLLEWALSLACLVVYAGVSGALCLQAFRRLARFDPVTAYFSAMPGGLAEMTLVGGAMGGDERAISLIHAARLLIVILCLPFAFQLLAGYDPGLRPTAGDSLAAIGGTDLVILTACGALGYFGARALGIPAAPIVGPMILSAIVHLAGFTAARPPSELIAAAQVIVGSAIGCRFAGISRAFVQRAVAAALGGTAIHLGATLAFAGGLAAITGLQFEALVLAYSPGGLAEMSLIALAVGADAAFVATHHIFRIFTIVVLAPATFRLLRRRNHTE
ncbi:MAG: AbrB family transcriptional regulator [Kiloniellales bacterium]|nr:AbrB family transcriptional regulator [Kiloniellales bacterium]